MSQMSLESLHQLYGKAERGEISPQNFKNAFFSFVYEFVFLLAINYADSVEDAERHVQGFFASLSRLPLSAFKVAFSRGYQEWTAKQVNYYFRQS